MNAYPHDTHIKFEPLGFHSEVKFIIFSIGIKNFHK